MAQHECTKEHHLAGSQGSHPGQFELLLVDLEPLGSPCYVALAQLAALLILDSGEHPEGSVLTCMAQVVISHIRFIDGTTSFLRV